MGLHTWVCPQRQTRPPQTQAVYHIDSPENEAEFESTFLHAWPGLMAARSPLPSDTSTLEKSQGTPRKGRAHLACMWLPDYLYDVMKGCSSTAPCILNFYN